MQPEDESIFFLKKPAVNHFLNVLYSTIFLAGISGNTYAIWVIIKVLKSPKNRQSNSPVASNHTKFSNFTLCTLFLCITDLVVIMIIPILILDTHVENWFLGSLACKAFWTIENGNKIGSRLILMAKTLERVIAVRFPHFSHLFTNRRSKICMLTLSMFLLVAVLPIFQFSDVMDVNVVSGYMSEHGDEGLNYDEHNDFNATTKSNRCMVLLPENLTTWYTLFLFSMGFCIPSLVIIVSYVCIVWVAFHRRRFHRQANNSNNTNTNNNRQSNRQSSWKKITAMSLLSVVLYLVCWTPFWLLTLMVMFRSDSDGNSPTIIFLFTYIAHPLVYVNSALNWIPYIFLNSHLREQYRKSVSATTPNKSRQVTSFRQTQRTRVRLLTSSDENIVVGTATDRKMGLSLLYSTSDVIRKSSCNQNMRLTPDQSSQTYNMRKGVAGRLRSQSDSRIMML